MKSLSNVNICIVWFRRDLRLKDNPAWHYALKNSSVIYPVYIDSPEDEKPWQTGGAGKWWLHQSIESLEKSLAEFGLSLILRQGNAFEELSNLVHEAKASMICWNRLYEPRLIARDKQIKEYFKGLGLEAQSFNSSLIFEPWAVHKDDQTPFKVFTPYYRAFLKKIEKTNFNEYLIPSASVSEIKKKVPLCSFASLTLTDLKLMPKINWYGGIAETWKPGEAAALENLTQFKVEAVKSYTLNRDLPFVEGTSRLSPYLHFGEISPARIWYEISGQLLSLGKGAKQSAEAYLRQLVWREFAYHTLFHWPHFPDASLRPAFDQIPWRDEPLLFKAWQEGRTGFPIVDAGMRELWQTGWMHNRVRMIVGSFLTKDLLIDWKEGAKYFWDTLVDADLANNSAGWQWVAGSGVESSPLVRVFNPVGQGQKFDPDGVYIRRFVPELAKLPDEYIHEPWTAPSAVLLKAGIILGKDYPLPIVDHKKARLQALMVYERIRSAPKK